MQSISSIRRELLGGYVTSVSLESVKLPENLQMIKKQSFYNCSKLSKIASLGGVTTLAAAAFRSDSGLAGSDYPDMSRITSIAKNVFNYCNMGGTVRLDSLTGTSNCDSAFNGAAITNVVFPRRDINLSGNYMFQNCSNLTGVSFPGPDSGTSEAQIRRSNCFSGCTSLKVFLAGPLTRLSDSYGATDETMFTNVSGCRMFVPNGTNWNIEYGLGAYEESNTIFYYGAGRELDMSFDNDRKLVTATPATAHALTNVLAAATTIKNVFGMDTRINVTNAIEIAAGSVSAAELAGVTFDSLTFAVKTQAQLDTVLAAVPVETPLAIDPEGATENLTVLTENRKIYVMLPTNGTYKVRSGGFIIFVQ